MTVYGRNTFSEVIAQYSCWSLFASKQSYMTYNIRLQVPTSIFTLEVFEKTLLISINQTSQSEEGEEV